MKYNWVSLIIRNLTQLQEDSLNKLNYSPRPVQPKEEDTLLVLYKKGTIVGFILIKNLKSLRIVSNLGYRDHDQEVVMEKLASILVTPNIIFESQKDTNLILRRHYNLHPIIDSETTQDFLSEASILDIVFEPKRILISMMMSHIPIREASMDMYVGVPFTVLGSDFLFTNSNYKNNLIIFINFVYQV